MYLHIKPGINGIINPGYTRPLGYQETSIAVRANKQTVHEVLKKVKRVGIAAIVPEEEDDWRQRVPGAGNKQWRKLWDEAIQEM